MPDVNVLVYAHRRDEATHASYRVWLEDVVNGSAPFGLSLLDAVAFVRLVTHRRIYDIPTPLPLALAEIDALAAQPNCRLVAPGPLHWGLVKDLCREGQVTGKLVADAQHAAVAIEHGCEWVTRDGDFHRFEAAGLRWRHLVLGAGASG